MSSCPKCYADTKKIRRHYLTASEGRPAYEWNVCKECHHRWEEAPRSAPARTGGPGTDAGEDVERG